MGEIMIITKTVAVVSLLLLLLLLLLDFFADQLFRQIHIHLIQYLAYTIHKNIISRHISMGG